MKPLPNGSAGPFVARSPWFGAIAQLGERLHGMQEVSGSIPLGSTNLLLIQQPDSSTPSVGTSIAVSAIPEAILSSAPEQKAPRLIARRIAVLLIVAVSVAATVIMPLTKAKP